MTAPTISIHAAQHNDRAVPILKWLLYILAGLVLVFGLMTGIGLIGFAGNLSGFGPVLQALSAQPLANMLASMLRQGAATLGTGVIVLSLVLSALLFTAGKLLGRTHDLARRVAHLEQVMARRE